MKRFHPFVFVFISMLLLTFIPSASIYALAYEYQGLDIECLTDRDSYEGDESIQIDVTVTNNNSFSVYYLTLSGAPLDNYQESAESLDTKRVDELKAGATAHLALLFEKPTATDEPSSFPTLLSLVMGGIGLLIILPLIVLSVVRKRKTRSTDKRIITGLIFCLLIGAFPTPVEAIQAETTDTLSFIRMLSIDAEETMLRIDLRYTVIEDAKSAHSLWQSEMVRASGIMTFQPPTSDKLAQDELSHQLYVHNEILLTTLSSATREDVEYLVDSLGATIVGEIELTHDYQIELPRAYSLAELNKIANQLRQHPVVEHVDPHILFSLDTSGSIDNEDITEERYIPNDKEWKNQKWDKVKPGSRNWGVMTINAPDAWNQIEPTASVKIGLIDSMFFHHTDLSFRRIWNNPGRTFDEYYADEKEQKGRKHHGTHVAGTMAAIHNNAYGIAGVARQAELYAYSILGSHTDPFYEEVDETENLNIGYMEYKYALAKLITEGCRVINFSMGNNWDNLQKLDNREEVLAYQADVFGNFLNKLIDAGYDFLIVQAAGNEGINTVNNGWFVNISIPEVEQRIIIVGNLGYDKKNYKIAESSNWGNRVDVLAPGTDIYSTVVGAIIFNTVYEGFSMKSGTSMAAPHISGIAAMCYAINPAFNGKQVKQFIVNSEGLTTVAEHRTREESAVAAPEEYVLADANIAVTRALAAHGEGTREVIDEMGLLLGVVSVEEPAPDTIADDFKITAKSLSRVGDEPITGTINEDGHYEMSLPVGHYRFEFSCPGYAPEEREIVILPNHVMFLEEVELRRIESSEAITDAEDPPSQQPSTVEEQSSASQDTTHTTLSPSEAELMAILQAATSKDVLDFHYADFDGDGEAEAFAFVGKWMDDDKYGAHAELWFVQKDGARHIVVESPMGGTGFYLPASFWTLDKMKMLYVVEGYYGSGTKAHVWILKDGQPSKLDNIDAYLSHLGGNDFGTAHSTFDAMADGTGHTWKRYYLYLDGDQFKEYGGIRITEEQLSAIKGTVELLEDIRSEGNRITDIFYRANGIININYTDDYSNGNVTMLLKGMQFELVLREDSSEDKAWKNTNMGGVYSPALFPEAATYPDRFPFP